MWLVCVWFVCVCVCVWSVHVVSLIFFRLSIFDTCVLRLTRVRARPYACLSVSRVCTVSYVAACGTFWLKSAGTVLRACCPLLQNGLAGAISLSSVKVVEDCLVGPPIGFVLQPARVVSHPAAVLDGQISARPHLGVGGCGPSV